MTGNGSSKQSSRGRAGVRRPRSGWWLQVPAFVVAAAALAWSAAAHSQACEAEAVRESVTVAYAEGASARRVTFTPSDDGTVRARDAADDRELWMYRAREAAIATVQGSFMTDLRVLRFDAHRDGSVDISGGDRVWLYFGIRRAGAAYYALDVTDPTVPQLLWHIGADQLPGAGESWSAPTIARVRVGGETQNGEHFVLIVGGGYDSRMNGTGNRVFMLDAATGHVLWVGGGPGASGRDPVGPAAPAPDLLPGQMRYPIPARVAAVDTDGDAFTDRLYAADLGGQVWRFDIWNGHGRSALVTGGVLASLGSAAPATSAAAASDAVIPAPLPRGPDARRFFSAPDVALIQRRNGNPYYNVAIGSGEAATLGAADVAHDRFYAIRDRNALTPLTQPTYDSTAPILDADLVDITGAPANARVPADAQGWKLDLPRATGASSGERVLAESLTANGVVLFTTFQPGASGCAADGTGYLYAVKVDWAQPALDLNDDGEISVDDLSTELTTGGIPGELHIDFTTPASEDSGALELPGAPPAEGDDAPQPQESTRCRAGNEALGHCVRLDGLLRTFWRRHSVN
jgi:type IV pilus assembly protein PilY1